MFNHIILFGMNFQEIFLSCILFLLISFLTVFLISLYRHRDDVNFYSIVVRENGRMSKVGIAFIFIMTLLVYQVVSGTEVSFYLVEMLGFIFAAELGTKFVNHKFLSEEKMKHIKNELKDTPKQQAKSARQIEDIDFDNL